MSDTLTYVDERHAVGRCTRCRTKIRADYSVELRQWANDGRLVESRTIIYPNGRRASIPRYAGAFETLRVYCPNCETRVSVRPVVGRVSTTKCGPRCTNAIGPDCECQCGGDNHGAGLVTAVTL